MPTYDDHLGLRLVRALLGSLQSALRRRAAGSAGLWATAAVLASLAGLLVTDAAVDFPRSARPIIYLAAWLAGAAGVAAAVGGAWARRPSIAYVARLIETARPELKNALITLVELQDDPQADPTMTAALGRRAARFLADAEPPLFLPPSTMRRPAMAAVGAAFLLGSGLWLAQGVVLAPWVTTAEAGPVVSLTGESATGGDPPPAAVPAALSGEPLQGEQPSEHAAKTAGGPVTGGSVPQAVTAGRAEPGDAGRSSQALAAALKADAAAFDRLAAALAAGAGASAGDRAAGAGASRREAVDRGSPRPADAGEGGADQAAPAPGDGSPGPTSSAARPDASRGSPTSADREPSAGDGAAAPRPDAGATRGPPKSPPQATDSRDPGAGGGGTSAPEDAGQGGGGDARSAGTSGRAPAGEPPLPNRRSGADFPAEALDFMHRAERIIKQAEDRLREGEVTDAMLQKMGMSHAEFRRFVTSWQRKFETAAGGPDAVSVPPPAGDAVEPLPGECLRPAQGPGCSPVPGDSARRSDGRKGLVQGSDSRVSPRLQPAVDGYFEAIGRRAGQAAAEDSRR